MTKCKTQTKQNTLSEVLLLFFSNVNNAQL